MNYCNSCMFKGNIKVPYEINSFDFIIVGEAPHTEEVQQKKPFVGSSGQVLNTVLKEVGLERKMFTIANAMCCKIDKKKDTAQKVSDGLNNCKKYLKALFEKTKPKLVITLGDIATKTVAGLQKITENRGRFFYVKLEEGRKSLGRVVNEGEDYDFIMFVTVHPAYIIRQARQNWLELPYTSKTPIERLLFDDFKLVAHFIKTGELYKIDTSEYVFTNDEGIKNIYTAAVVAFDIETTNARIYSPTCDVICLSITDCEGKAYVIKKEDFGPNLRKILEAEDIVKIVANRPFDEAVLEQKLGIKVKGDVIDIFTLAHIIDENFKISLESISNAYTDLRNIKDLADGMRSNLLNADEKTLLQYSGVDADATFRSGQALLDKLIEIGDKKLITYFKKFILPIQNMLTDIHKNGVLIDTKKLKENEERLLKTLEELEYDAIKMIPKVILLLHLDKGLRLSRNELVSDYLFKHSAGLKLEPKYFTEKTKEPAITEAHLKLFSHRAFVDLYLKWKKGQKIYSTYFPQLWQNIYENNRIYPSVVLYRTVTGRTVMLNPAIQTFPKRGEFASLIRECIVPDKGWIIGERDLSQSELRIMGWLANDKSILEALQKGIDLHTKTAAVINNVPVDQVTKDMRDKAKPVNFGFLYGMSAKSFKQYAKDEYGIDFTEDECIKIRQKFFEEYKALPKYYESVLEFARVSGYIKGVLGRIRHLPQINSQDEFERGEAERQAINFRIQNFSSDLGLIGMYLFWKKIKENNLEDSIKPFWFIHDAILFQAKKEVFNDAMSMLKECLEVETKKYIKEWWGVEVGYPIESEGKYSETNWAEMKTYKD